MDDFDWLLENPDCLLMCWSGRDGHGPASKDDGRKGSGLCVSCGKTMDRRVYFTVCPHCGHNYRIEVLPVDVRESLSLRSLVLSFFFATVVAAGAVTTVVVILLLT